MLNRDILLERPLLHLSTQVFDRRLNFLQLPECPYDVLQRKFAILIRSVQELLVVLESCQLCFFPSEAYPSLRELQDKADLESHRWMFV